MVYKRCLTYNRRWMHKWHGYWKREEPIGSNKGPHPLLVVATIQVALDLGDVVVDVDDMKKNGYILQLSSLYIQ